MRIGQKNRAVGATALNERSSRSHSVLTIHVYGKELVSGSILKGCLHLVDLAGSGQAKTLMFVHISPEVNAIGETISTLKFAERVASIELGAARSNKETGEIQELKEEISNLKLALEKKEAEVEQLKVGNVRSMTESQRGRAVSPFQIPRHGTSSSIKPGDDNRSSEATSRSASSGKQRRSRFPSAFADKEMLPKMPSPAEERLASALKARSPSPPVRRSSSTDRGASNRSRTKVESVDNQPISRVPFPARVPVNKSFATTTVAPSSDATSSGIHSSFQETTKQENISDALYNLRKLSIKKVHSELEDEQFRQALNVRQGGIRKNKAESKAKIKHQLPATLEKADVAMTLLSEMDDGEKMEQPPKSDFSEPETEQSLVGSPMYAALKMKKLGHNLSRYPHNFEQRGFVQPQAVVPLQGGKTDRSPKEGSNTNLMPEFRRSRSTPRGKFLVLP
ncbi:hypothetical protein Goari_017788 [Gossypium aridum]|uniref:Kinesin motor domain-containing protein n=1 Tax=Gossypium aridum TaxID=34290 RepID=A0A7J8WMW9_GOSAI|nr:hypothetical protein [Gossypium aridum]